MDLKEWTKTLLRARDAMKQEIQSIEDAGPDFIVHKSTGDHTFLIRPQLTAVDDISKRANGPLGLVLLNTKKNLNFVIEHWQTLAAHKQLCIYFVNPSTNDKWLLYPYTHNQITEKTALRRGLETMFSEVPPAV